MTFKRCLTRQLLSVRSKLAYLLVLLYILIYLLGVLGVLPPLTGRFIAPAALLLYAFISSAAIAFFTGDSKRDMRHETFRVIRNAATGEIELPLSQIVPGDSVILCAGDYIPFSGDVVKGFAQVLQDGVLVPKSPETGRAHRDSYHVTAGSAVYAGNIIVEAEADDPIIHMHKRGNSTEHQGIIRGVKAFFTGRSLEWWVRLGACVTALFMFVFRFFASRMLYLGTYESLLDNLTLSCCLILFASPFGSDADFLPAAFGKLRSLHCKRGGSLETAGMAESLAVDGQLLFTRADPVFNIISADEDGLTNLSDIDAVPEPIRSLLRDNIKTLTENRFGFVSLDADDNALRRFAKLSPEDYANSDAALLSEIPFTPESGFKAATYRHDSVTVTEYLGKSAVFSGSFAHDTAGNRPITQEQKDKLLALFDRHAAEGKRVRIAAVNRTKIRDGALPQTGWLILGYFTFPSAPTFAIKKAVNAATDSGLSVSLLPTEESPAFENYLNSTLRLAEKNAPPAGIFPETEKPSRAALAFDITAACPAADTVVIAPAAAASGVIGTADIITNTENPAEAFTDAVNALTLCRKFRIYKNFLWVLIGITVLFAFILFTFVFRSLPVSFGDEVIPAQLLTALFLGTVETVVMKAL